MRNKRKTSALLLYAIPFFVLCSCKNIVDLSDLDISTYPARNAAIIPATESIWIEFDQDVRHVDAENCISVKTFSGSVSFDKTWMRNRLILTPMEAWHPGVAYVLSCSGLITTNDGLSFSVHKSVSFFATSSSLPPVLLSRIPANDGIVSRNAAIKLLFSKALSAEHLDQFVHTSPEHDIAVTLADNGKSILITPVTEWDGLTRYQWTVSEDLRDTEGITVLAAYSGYFRSQLDTEPLGAPKVASVDLMDTSTRLSLDQIKNGMGLLFEFDKAIDWVTFKKQFTIDPPLAMSYRILSDSAILAYPEDSKWKSGQKYAVTVKKDVTDTAGNKAVQDFTYAFTSCIPLLGIESISNTPGSNGTPMETFGSADLVSGSILKIGVNAGVLEHYFSIKFSRPMSGKEAERLTAAISLEKTFPPDGGNPALEYIGLVIDPGDTIILKYSNFSLPTETNEYEHVYYKFRIKGGPQGFVLDDGRMLGEDLTVYLETKKAK